MQPETSAPVLLSGWGRATRTAGGLIEPAEISGVESAIVKSGLRGVIGRGMGRSYGDAAQNAGGTVISTLHLDSISRGTVVAGAGVSLRRLLAYLLPQGLTLPVLPGTADVSVGGAIAADVHGKNHHADGAFAKHVDSFRLATPGGIIDVSREREPQLFNATAGGMGLTGVIVDATLETEPVSSASVSMDTDRATDLESLMALMSEGDERYKFSVAWIDCFARGKSLGRGLLQRANYASGPADGSLDGGRSQFADGSRPAPPDLVPTGALMPIAVRAFNEFRYRRSPSRERGKVETFSTFFHPLDVIGDWNRLYGKAGFLQYQFVVPYSAKDVVRKVLEEQVRLPSYLAVLKQMGPPSGGMLSFPIEGWTLALDFPVIYDGLGEMLDRFDQWVVEAGGRVYLAKDSRMSPGLLDAMYPQLGAWREIAGAVDSEDVFQSDLSRRLRIRE